LENPALFLASIIVLLIMPGPTNTLLATSGATVGFRRSIPMLAGELAGYLVAIFLIQFVLGPAMSRSPATALALRLAAAAYLMILSVKLWRTPFMWARAVVSLRQVFVTTLLNPKALVFALVIIPFSSPHPGLYLSIFAATIPLIGTLWISFGTFLGRHAQPAYLGVVPKAASVVLAVISAILVSSALYTRAH
jgi:threonine/homoserine/homoserine lactone efflux protein